MLFALTSAAVEKVKSVLAERGIEGGLRIAMVGGSGPGLQYRMALEKQPKDDDKVFEQDGLKIFVDMQSLLYLNGTRIDYIDSATGSGFKFDNPNLRARCGCGEPFYA